MSGENRAIYQFIKYHVMVIVAAFAAIALGNVDALWFLFDISMDISIF